MAAVPLTPAEITALPTTLPAWGLVDGKLQRQFTFHNFSEAFGFMARVALAAETLGHHPRHGRPLHPRCGAGPSHRRARGLSRADQFFLGAVRER
jgi:hypothetical protein